MVLGSEEVGFADSLEECHDVRTPWLDCKQGGMSSLS